MGCDGGTIPKRDELVRQKKKAEVKDKQSELSFRWGHCTITQQPLQKPIVACQLGRFYSKVAVIEALIDKTKLPETAQHIKSIKDVKEVNLTKNPAFKSTANKTNEVYDDSLTAPYICPIIGLEMTGRFRFVVIWSCGCVISERAMKMVSAKLCHKCQKPFTDEDVIILNGTEDDVASSTVKMDSRKARVKAAKKSSKLQNGAAAADGGSGSSSNGTGSAAVSELSDPKPSTSAQGRKIPETSKRPAPAVDLVDPKFKKTKSDYSVAKDPKASEVYKSLFTSHDSAAKQTRAHWITYNPFYN